MSVDSFIDIQDLGNREIHVSRLFNFSKKVLSDLYTPSFIFSGFEDKNHFGKFFYDSTLQKLNSTFFSG